MTTIQLAKEEYLDLLKKANIPVTHGAVVDKSFTLCGIDYSSALTGETVNDHITCLECFARFPKDFPIGEEYWLCEDK